MSSNTASKQTVKKQNRSSLRYMVQIGMLSGLAVVLMLFEVPLPFAPPFYKLDLSELPVLIGSFAMGPAAGVVIELVKILLNLVITGSQTMGVGEAANFVIGCSLIVPAAVVYKRMKTRKGAVIGMVLGTVVLAVTGALINGLVLLPAYSVFMGLPMDTLIGMGTAVNAGIANIYTFVLLAVVPFNIVKGVVVSLITLIIYKYVSPVLKANQ